MRHVKTIGCAAGLMLISAGMPAIAADTYPGRPIRMIAPFPAGSGADGLGRMLANSLSNIFQQQVVVDNRGGASSIIGTGIAAKAAPDGYTILFVTSAHAINAAIRRSLPFDPVQDFAPISLFTVTPFILVTHPSFPAKSVLELLDLARAKPRQINYASAGYGSAVHFAAAMLNAYAKIELVHVSYKGAAGAMTDVLAGAVPITFLGSAVMPSVKAGKLRALAVTTAKRSPVWPDLPTIQESGVPRYNFTNWHGLLAPRNTRESVVARLNGAIVQATQDKSLVNALTSYGAELQGNTPEQFRDFLVREIAKYQELVRGMGGLKVE